MRCWGLAATAGMASQVNALAYSLGLAPEVKHISLRPPFSWLPNVCYSGLLSPLVLPCVLGSDSDKLAPPWPDLVISCGRRSAIAALGLKRAIGRGETQFIHIQDPQVDPAHFDLVIAMDHDRVEGPNVIKTQFALHGITPQALAEAKQKFASRFAHYPRPHVAVLLGGSTNKYALTRSGMEEVASALQRLLDSMPGSLLITPSRRTGQGNVDLLRGILDDHPRVYIYDGASENPYMGLLALADAVVVSNDSVNMMTEATATGKAVYLLLLPGHANTKPARFAQKLVRDGIARPLLGAKLEDWHYPLSNEMERLTAEVKTRLVL